jgi:hypothetical protein
MLNVKSFILTDAVGAEWGLPPSICNVDFRPEGFFFSQSGIISALKLGREIKLACLHNRAANKIF